MTVVTATGSPDGLEGPGGCSQETPDAASRKDWSSNSRAMGAVDTAPVHCQAPGYRKQLQRNSIRIPERQWLLATIKEWTDDEVVLSTDHRAAGANVLAFVPAPRGL